MEKNYGLAGNILRVNLTNGTIEKEPSNPSVFKKFIGGRGLGAWMLYHEVPAKTDPLGPDNKLIFMAGPTEGTITPGANKITVTFKSPLTNTYATSLCGGHLGPELKFAGYDGVVIEGKASEPCYLWIDDDKVRIMPAKHLWGKNTHETEDVIRKELGDINVKVAVIGKGGENLVKYACIQTDYHREFGRQGSGAVMGSKLLKAIAIRGTKSIPIAEPEKLAQLTLETYQILANHPKANARKKMGTNELVDGINSLGFMANKNFTEGTSLSAANITGTAMVRDVVFGDVSCYGCNIVCGKNTQVLSSKYGKVRIEGPEFETLTLLGTNTGVYDWEHILRATQIFDEYGVDTMSGGSAVALAMECYEKGIITDEDTDGIKLHFGNGEALCQVAELIGQRKGIGAILADGSLAAATKWGVPELAMQVKGSDFAAYDPRGAKGMGLTYATSPKGAHHMIAPTFGVEIAQNNRFSEEGKAALVRETQFFMAIVDSMALCSSMRFALNLGKQLQFISAVTGWDLNEQEAMVIGERILNVERMFNVREGFSRKDDTLPKRFLEEPLKEGSSQGQVVNLEKMLNEYYELMGWNQEGIPTAERLGKLGICY